MLSHPSYAVAVLGFAARVSATVRAALRRRVRAPRVLRGTTVGALVLCGLFTVLAVAEAPLGLPDARRLDLCRTRAHDAVA